MSDESAPEETRSSAQPAAEFRAVDLARAAQLLPEFINTGLRSRPVDVNPNYWKYRAAKMRFGFDDQTQLTQEHFDLAIAAISAPVHVR